MLHGRARVGLVALLTAALLVVAFLVPLTARPPPVSATPAGGNVKVLPSAALAGHGPVVPPAGVAASPRVARPFRPGKATGPVGEDPKRRAAAGRVVNNGDGTLTVQVANGPINYRIKDGWSPIDNTVRSQPGGWVGTSANSWTVAFGPGDQGLRLNTTAGVLSVTPVGAAPVAPKVAERPAASSAPTPADVPAGLAPGVVTFASVWPHTDVVDTVGSERLSQDLVLRDGQAPAQFAFDISGAPAVTDPAGGVSLGGAWAGVVSIGDLRVLDANGVDVTNGSGASLSVSGGRMVVRVDPAWLGSLPAKAFPVTIDPEYNFVNPDSATSYPTAGSTVSGDPIRVGTSGSTSWAAAVGFNLGTYEALGAGYRVYDAKLEFPGFNCSCSAPSSSPLKVFDQHGPVGSYAQIGTGPATLVQGPWTGPFVEVGSSVNAALAQGAPTQWFGVTYTGALTQFNVTFLDLTVFLPPAPSQVTNLANNAVLATTTPTLVGAPINPNPDDPNQHQMYDYQVTTGPTPGTGLVIDSGRLCQNTTGQPDSTCSPGGAAVPTWTVPAGVLSEGVTYHAWVLTDWYGNGDQVPDTIPPASSGVAFKIRLGLGAGGPSPTDSVGSVPGQTSTPSAGAPSPGIAGSKVTVNMVDGNMSFTVATPKLATAGGGLGLSLTYNSLSATDQSLNQGLQGLYYNDPSGADVGSDQVGWPGDRLVGVRVDPAVDFDWANSPAVAAQQPGEAAVRWSGSISFPFTGTWALGDISSDGTQISAGTGGSLCPGNTCLSDWGPHAPQVSPTFGSAFTVSSTGPVPIVVDWHHSSNQPQLVQLYAENFATSPPTVYLVPTSWLTHARTVMPAGWTFNSNAGAASLVGLVDHGTSVTAFAADGSGYEFTKTTGGYAAPTETPTANLKVDGSGNFVLDDGAGLVYTFNPQGQPLSVRSATDDLKPASLQYSYTASPPQLTSISDPVSGRSATVVYGGGPGCPRVSGDSPAPPGMLCAINYWDGTRGCPEFR
ncbi:MAG: hypothetical protein DLM65_05385, partial [Candidatus Aeolococcus gillhamiae]